MSRNVKKTAPHEGRRADEWTENFYRVNKISMIVSIVALIMSLAALALKLFLVPQGA